MKNIIIITQGLSRIVKPLFNSKDVNIIGIIECAPRGISIPRISFIFSLYHKIRRKKESELLLFSENNSIPYFYMTSSSKELEFWVKNLDPDLMVVYIMSQLLTQNIYSIPRFGTINLHPSLLPKYRGPNPCFWTYYNMDKIGGVTVHFIDKGEDTGDILLQEEYEIPLGIKSPDRFDVLISQIGVNLLMKSINNIETIIPLKQPKESTTTRARNITLKEHNSIIDWNNWQIEKIWHILRGTELWLNALEQPKGVFLGTRWEIGAFERIEIDQSWSIGKIYNKKGKYFVVCKEGVIYLSKKINIKELLITLLISQ
jgi:methionyl-tRNA formyltransferase